MTDGKTKVQADGKGTDARSGKTMRTRPDGPGQHGESGGGAYPNPHSGKSDSDHFDGGQSDKAYHGHGQLGDDDQTGVNPNAPAKGD